MVPPPTMSTPTPAPPGSAPWRGPARRPGQTPRSPRHPPRPRRAPPDRPAERQERGGGQILRPHLDQAEAGFDALGDHRDQVATAGRIAVGDEAEAHGAQSGTPSRGEDAVA